MLDVLENLPIEYSFDDLILSAWQKVLIRVLPPAGSGKKVNHQKEVVV